MAGSATPRGDGSPFDLPGRPGGADAALLLHGLTGSPFELRPVADRLHAAGVRCVAPALPGHESPDALARWIPAVLPEWIKNPPAPLPYGGAHSWDVVAAELLEAADLHAEVPAAATGGSRHRGVLRGPR